MRFLVYGLFFFFSSRRRHTRYWRDWSSDVCSSDLRVGQAGAAEAEAADRRVDEQLRNRLAAGGASTAALRHGGTARRLGERRGGEEGRSWWAPYHLKKKSMSNRHD